MEFFQRASGAPQALGVFPGTFNPPTLAHFALAHAALALVDEVVFVLPRVFPHKPWEGASFEDRVEMLRTALAAEPRCSIASTEKGLFIDIARDARAAYGDVVLHFLCGRDAAERIVNWDYGTGPSIEEQLKEYGLLVAPREGEYESVAPGIRTLPLPAGYNDYSATEVRERIRTGRPWQHLVPEPIIALVKTAYAK